MPYAPKSNNRTFKREYPCTTSSTKKIIHACMHNKIDTCKTDTCICSQFRSGHKEELESLERAMFDLVQKLGAKGDGNSPCHLHTPHTCPRPHSRFHTGSNPPHTHSRSLLSQLLSHSLSTSRRCQHHRQTQPQEPDSSCAMSSLAKHYCRRRREVGRVV